MNNSYKPCTHVSQYPQGEGDNTVIVQAQIQFTDLHVDDLYHPHPNLPHPNDVCEATHCCQATRCDFVQAIDPSVRSSVTDYDSGVSLWTWIAETCCDSSIFCPFVDRRRRCPVRETNSSHVACCLDRVSRRASPLLPGSTHPSLSLSPSFPSSSTCPSCCHLPSTTSTSLF